MMPISTEPQIFIMDRVSSERKRSRKKRENIRSYFANFVAKFRIFLRK